MPWAGRTSSVLAYAAPIGAEAAAIWMHCPSTSGSRWAHVSGFPTTVSMLLLATDHQLLIENLTRGA